MKNVFMGFVLSVMTASIALAEEPEQDSYTLSCKAFEVCFEQSLQKPAHQFTVETAGDYKIEVTAKNGAAVSFKTANAQSTTSAMQMGPEPVDKTITMQVFVAAGADFSLEVETAKVMRGGKPLDEGKSYNLKIIKTNAAVIDKSQGVSI